nr:hypothetical protein [Tanacetum cinerariifolium]
MLVQGPILQSDLTISPPPISSPSRVPTPPHDSPLSGAHHEGKGVGAQSKVKQARRRVRLIVSEDEDDLEDPSKQRKKIAQIDDEGITLVDMGAHTQGRNEHEVESNFDFTTAEGISTANVPVTTGGAEISTASPEDKTAKTCDDSDDITLAKTLIEIKRTRMDADHELAARLTYEEQEQFIIKEKAKLLTELFERRKKQLAAKRSEAIKNKPPTRTQVRNIMITYLKHMGTYTHQHLKHKSLEELQKMYQKEQKWIHDFKPMDDDSQQQVESSKKRQREVSDEESFKKQKLEEDNDTEKKELRAILDIVPRDGISFNVESLATKYPIVDWKTYILTENMMYYQIIRADGSSKNYKIFSEMLDDFDRQDVIDLHRLIQKRYEKTYLLTQEMLSRMLNRRLEVDHESEMAFELLRFTRSQLKE